MTVPDLSAYRFTASHEWVRREGASATVGISDHAQEQLGDIIFIELPEVGATLSAGQKFGSVESVKAASDLYAPVGGTVEAVNDRLADSPELVNGDPYGDGWMLRLSGVEEGSSELMDEGRYQEVTGS
jgi:glycine cleavage system H protein